jgi:hypothetical protein
VTPSVVYGSLGFQGSFVMIRYAVLPRCSFGHVTLAPGPWGVTCLLTKPTIPLSDSSFVV